MKKNHLLFILLSLFAWTLNAQVEKCGTVEVHERLKQQYPEHYAEDGEFEHWLQEQQIATADQRANGAVLTIPVVVHVIHNGDAVGTNENISDAQVLSQIKVLNEDYRRISGTPGYNNDPVGADTEIEFCLAEVDPFGNATNGIDRVNAGQSTWSSNTNIDNSLKPSTVWDANNYMNVWVVNFGNSGLLGYAQFPSNSGLSGLNTNGGPASTDGVVIGYNYFGSIVDNDGSFSLSAPYNRGRTATHEIGHWLGLRHIWGDGGCGVDDFCNDTPDSDAANYGCATGHLSCGSTDMPENYMDYSDDSCMNIFTQDQKARMTTVMTVAARRASLLNSQVCNLTPQAPDAAFSTNTTSGCSPLEVSFFDQSSFDPTSWSWSFPGGSPSSYPGQFPPLVTYSTPGTYTASLTVSNDLGSDVMNMQITATDCGSLSCEYLDHLNGGAPTLIPNPNGGGYVSGHSDFQDAAKVEYFDDYGAATILKSVDFDFGLASGNGDLEFIVLADNGGTPGAEIASTTVPISSIASDVSSNSLTTVNFGQLSITGPFYAGFKLNYNDGSEIAVRTNSNGDTNPTNAWEQWSDGDWYPFNDYTSSNTTWELDIALAIYPEVCQDNVGVEDIEGFSSLSIFPNPMTDMLHVEMASEKFLDLSVDVFDAMGRKVISGGTVTVSGTTVESYDTSDLAPGTYFVRVTNGEHTTTEKLLKL